MPEAQHERNYLSLRKGLNTVSNEITFPDEFTSDELNYTIEPDGSRRRRRGCKRESGGSVKTIQTGGTYFGANDWCTSFKWSAAGGDPSNALMVHQIGSTLWFTNDAETVSTTFHTQQVDLTNKKLSAATSAATIAGEPCSFAVHRGFLIVTHKYLSPFYVSYTYPDDAWVLTTKEITVLIRDFEGLEDGVAVDHQPKDAEITEEHRYNLRNRGWREADITEYRAGAPAAFPAKNMLPWKGFTRQAVSTGYETSTGTQDFSVAKMAAEVFSNMSAPQGSIIINPLDTTQSFAAAGEDGPTVELISDEREATITAADDGFVFANTHAGATTDANDSNFRLRLRAPLFKASRNYTSGTTTIEITGFEWLYTTSLGADGYEPWYDINGTWTLYAAKDNDTDTNDSGHDLSDAEGSRKVWLTLDDSNVYVGAANGGDHATTSTVYDSLTFYVTQVDGSWDEFTEHPKATILGGGTLLTSTTGKTLTVGPTACEAFAGRIFYAGVPDSEWSDTVFFSQIALRSKCFGSCYQQADPTSEYLNSLASSDGGTIVIPNLGEVVQLKAVRNALLVFATNGVWEISGGRSGFSAENYVVRQITDAGCSAPLSVTALESSTIYTGPKGIIALAPNQYTGQLESQNLIESTIQPTWNAIPAAKQQRVQTAYDDAKQRIYVLYREDATVARYLDKALVFDLKHQGWHRLGFNNNSLCTIDNDTGMLTVFAISEADSSATDQKMKFLVAVNDDGGSDHKVDICDMNQSDYLDFQDHNSNIESPLPYLVTGWDSSVGSNRRRQAPIITVYSKRTNTGYTTNVEEAGYVNTTANTANTLLLQSNASGSNDTYNAKHVLLVEKTVDNGTRYASSMIVRRVTDYVGSTKVATIDPVWRNIPESYNYYIYTGADTTTHLSSDDTDTHPGGELWTETNGSSTNMTPFWDWTEEVEALSTIDHGGDRSSTSASHTQRAWTGDYDSGSVLAGRHNVGISGKIGKTVQVYKHPRAFNPIMHLDEILASSTSTYVDGYPIVATRNKIRGRGRTLSLRFDGAAAKDSHLLGFTINYKISRRI